MFLTLRKIRQFMDCYPFNNFHIFLSILLLSRSYPDVNLENKIECWAGCFFAYIYTHFGFMFTHLHILINQCGCVDKVHTDIVCSFLQYQSTVVITMATLSAVPAICFHFEVHFLYMLRKYCFPFRFDEAVHWKAFFLFCCYSSNFIKEFIFLFYCSYWRTLAFF